MDQVLAIILIVVAALVGVGIGFGLIFVIPAFKSKTAGKRAEKIIRDRRRSKEKKEMNYNNMPFTSE